MKPIILTFFYCRSSMSNRGYYSYHLKKHIKFHEINSSFQDKRKTKKNQKKLKCTLCEFTGKYTSLLKQHVESIHENVKRFYCDVCNGGFYYLHQLRGHYKAKHGKDLSEDSTKYTRGSVKEKIYYTLPRPKRGKWIVILERLWNHTLNNYSMFNIWSPPATKNVIMSINLIS